MINNQVILINNYALIQCHNTQINVFNYALSDEPRTGKNTCQQYLLLPQNFANSRIEKG